MPIKAKYNSSYKDITDLMNVDESIDYVLAKTSSSYKRVYTATRSIEDAPPTTFKSIKPGANLTDYRIYGNTSKNILPLSKTPKTETIGDILCEYDGKGTFKFTSNVDNPTYTQDQWFWVPFEEDFDFPVGISDGGHGCIQLNNDFATGHGVTPYLVGFANRDNGEFVSGFNVAGTALNIIDTNYEVEDLEGLPANCIAFLYLHQIGKRTVTIKPALYLDIRTQQPFEPYCESVGDRTGNLFSAKLTQGSFSNSTGAPTVVPDRVRSNKNTFIFLNSGTYTINASGAHDVVVYCYSSNDVSTFVKSASEISWRNLPYIFTANADYYYLFAFRNANNSAITPSDISNIMLNEGSTALPYEPYGYKVPVTVSNGTDTLTTPIYLPEPIKMVGDEAEYIDYGEQKQYIETTDGQEKYVVGLNVDFENKTFTRLADAIGLSKGTDFDIFSAFGGRRRCNVADNGTITAYYGDANYTEDGSNGQVMVYQPAFYYKVEPLKTEAQESGVGYHLRNVNYYISNHQGSGFKLHPAFYDANGNAVDYILLSAYEGSMYDASAEAYVNDSVDTSIAYATGDLLCSVAGKKPISGLRNGMGTKANFEAMANNRGSGWHLNTIKAECANLLLMIVELGTMNTQTGIGQGVVSITDNRSYNCSSLTGSTASLGNGTGSAASTVNEKGGTETTETASGKVSVTYRGVENPWGNIWKHTQGVNIWGDGHMGGGQPYVANNFSFNESKHTENYEAAGFTLANASGYINAMGWGGEENSDFDWLLMPSEIGRTSALPVGDYLYVNANLDGYKIALLGGYWSSGAYAGGFYWYCDGGVGFRARNVGGRLVYIPQIEKQHIYTTDLDVTLPALPTLPGTNVLSVGTEVQPSKIDITGHIKTISGGS